MRICNALAVASAIVRPRSSVPVQLAERPRGSISTIFTPCKISTPSERRHAGNRQSARAWARHRDSDDKSLEHPRAYVQRRAPYAVAFGIDEALDTSPAKLAGDAIRRFRGSRTQQPPAASGWVSTATSQFTPATKLGPAPQSPALSCAGPAWRYISACARQ